MKRNISGNIKKKIAFAAILIGIVLVSLTLLFIRGVQDQLWEESITAIMENTQQGCNTLRIQLKNDYESMSVLSKDIKKYSLSQTNEIETIINNYGHVEENISMYTEDGSYFPKGNQIDKTVQETVLNSDITNGIIDPHISSITGVNVFNIFIRTTMNDGTKAYLVKEYEIENIVESFSLSFYNDAGFSYVINTKGDVLIRPPHPNSNKTVKNLFDMLPTGKNDANNIKQFAQSLENNDTGWAIFTYQNEKTVFCFTPLQLKSDWFLISIIPKDVVDAQTNDILIRSMLLIGCILLGIILLALFYFHHANKTNKKITNQTNYIGHLYNALPEGVALITVNQPFKLIQLNQEGLRLLHYPDGSLNDAPKGKELKDFIYHEDADRIIKDFTNVSLNSQRNTFEHRIVRTDGSFFWASVIVEKTISENGEPVLIAAFHDITKEKLAEEAAEREKLQERITLVKAISNAYPVIISINLSKDTLNFIYMKEGLMIGLGKQKTYTELYNQIVSTIHTDSIEEFKERFAPETLTAALGKEKNEIFIECKQILSDKKYHWISTQIIYVDNPYSKDKLAILISRRIDEQRYEEEQRRQALQSALDSAKSASEAKSQFLSNMSHDIRTPMNAILGMTAIATTHIDDRERVLDCLKKIGLSSNHLLSLINDVLDMSKIESGKLSLRNEPFNFAELVADSIELVRSQAIANQLKLNVRFDVMKNENVIGDPLRIRQVYINILSNAVKYTKPGGTVSIEVKQRKSIHKGYQNYIFVCSDTGIGMSPDFIEKLFQPFERSNDSSADKINGTGLGMAITKNIIDLMNGDIQVESTLGKGSVFTVTFPLQLQDAPKDEIPHEWKGIRCLIIDDDIQSCKDAAELLEEIGLRAEYTTEGKTAVETVIREKDTSDPFRLVIVDWKMPDMDGIETTRQLRQKIGSEIPVIILTAYDWSEIEHEAKKSGVTSFISKPFYRSKLCYLLNELSGDNTSEESNNILDITNLSDKHVLLVEDNEINREIARTIINEMGIQTDEAKDGEEAVKIVSESEIGYYDLILMDIQMPKMDGYSATKAIRLLDRADASGIPIIAMTANAFEEDIWAARRAGMNGHLSKPVNIEKLKSTLINVLNGNSAD